MVKFALIVADPNSDELGEIVSTHRTAQAAHRERGRLGRAQWKWAYVAEQQPDGSYPHRVQALELPAHGVGAA